MMIEKYISDLLYRYQCVTVPNFGAFITETVSARVNEESQTFFPPQKVIAFNANITNNDGLLANHIATNEKINYEKALDKIANQVAIWNAKLITSNVVSLENIGTFSLNKESKIVFEANSNTNYLTSAFGLSSFTQPEIKREVYKQQVEALEEKAPIVFTPERKKNYSFVKYAAVITLFLAGGLYGGKTYYDNQIETQTLLVQKQVQEKVQEQIQQATFFIDVPVTAIELPVKEEKMPYHLIAAAFRNEENAEKALQMLKEQGFKAVKLEKNKHDLIPVAYGSYKTLEEAQEAKSKLHQEEQIEAWLLIE